MHYLFPLLLQDHLVVHHSTILLLWYTIVSTIEVRCRYPTTEVRVAVTLRGGNHGSQGIEFNILPRLFGCSYLVNKLTTIAFIFLQL